MARAAASTSLLVPTSRPRASANVENSSRFPINKFAYGKISLEKQEPASKPSGNFHLMGGKGGASNKIKQ